MTLGAKWRHKQSQETLGSVISDTKGHGPNQNTMLPHQGLSMAGEDIELTGKNEGGCSVHGYE